MSEIKITLQDVADVIDCEHKTAPIDDNGEYRSVRTSDLRKGKILHRQCNKVSKETYDNWTKRRIPKSGDIILSREAPVGEIGYVEKDETYCLGQRTVLISPKNQNIHGRFLSYFLQTNEAQEEMSSRSAGSVVTHLNMSEIRNLTIPQIDIKNQIQIAEVLSSIDDKIDLLHRNNKTLEEMAETLFRQWFVEGAKEEWEEGELGDFVNIAYGKNLPTKNLTPSGYPVFGANGQIGFYRSYTYSTPQILVSCRGEASGKVNFSIENSFVTNNSLILERTKRTEISFEYLKYYSLSADFKTFVTGSAQPQITIETLRRARFILPNLEILQQFTNHCAFIEEKINANNKNVLTLTQLRDTLLPKLMSGQVRVNI